MMIVITTTTTTTKLRTIKTAVKKKNEAQNKYNKTKQNKGVSSVELKQTITRSVVASAELKWQRRAIDGGFD